MYSPILLFAYNRPYHLRQTIDALLNNTESSNSELIIYSDGPKSKKDLKKVNQVREYIRSIQGFKSLKIFEQEKNQGLARSVINGVTDVLSSNDSVIVLEDDLVVSPYFLKYMNDGLVKYKDEEGVISIHGYTYPVDAELPETFFLRGADCWGWGTWRRGWEIFNPDGNFLLNELEKRNLINEFDFKNSYPFSNMLRAQIKGNNDSWAIRWHASAFLANKLTLYPGKSLVKNIGNDGSGTHSTSCSKYGSTLAINEVVMNDIPIAHSLFCENYFVQYFRSHKNTYKDKYNLIIKDIRMTIRKWIPPILMNLLSNNINLVGPYDTWQEAEKNSDTYSSTKILDKVLDSTLKVIEGSAVYERDSVLFHDNDVNWPMLTGILLAAADSKGKLDVLDYGGSLGSSYFQHKSYFNRLSSVNWSVIEQDHFVEAGIKYVQNNNLAFFNTIEDCLKNRQPNVILLSSVLQYLKQPFTLIDYLTKYTSAGVMIIDRTPFSDEKENSIYVQNVPSYIYNASYPMSILSIELFQSIISNNWKINSVYNTKEGMQKIHSIKYTFKGYILTRK